MDTDPFFIELKISQSSVMDNPDDEAIIDAIIAIAHRLKLKVIAEGVEEVAQLNFLREYRCDEVQGFYFARPMPTTDLLEMLSRQEG